MNKSLSTSFANSLINSLWKSYREKNKYFNIVLALFNKRMKLRKRSKSNNFSFRKSYWRFSINSLTHKVNKKQKFMHKRKIFRIILNKNSMIHNANSTNKSQILFIDLCRLQKKPIIVNLYQRNNKKSE
jgi:hypothetical protein